VPASTAGTLGRVSRTWLTISFTSSNESSLTNEKANTTTSAVRTFYTHAHAHARRTEMNVDASHLPINRMMEEDCTLDDRIQADDCDIELGESVVAIELALARVCGSRTGETLSKMWSVSFPTCVVYCVRISQSISATEFDTERARERERGWLARSYAPRSHARDRGSRHTRASHTLAPTLPRDIDRSIEHGENVGLQSEGTGIEGRCTYTKPRCQRHRISRHSWLLLRVGGGD